MESYDLYFLWSDTMENLDDVFDKAMVELSKAANSGSNRTLH